MMIYKRMLGLSFFGLLSIVHGVDSPLFEAKKACAYIEFTIKREVEREEGATMGIVVDNQGTLAVSNKQISTWVPDSFIEDIKVYPLDATSTGYRGTFLGRNPIDTHYFIQVEPAALPYFEPVKREKSANPKIGMPLWGIRTVRYEQFVRLVHCQNPIALVEDKSIWQFLLTLQPIGNLGSSVFDAEGKFAGQVFDRTVSKEWLDLGDKTYPADLTSRNVGNIILNASEFFKIVESSLKLGLKAPTPWLGIGNFQAVPHEVLDNLHFEKDKGALLVSQIFDESPAAKAQLMEGDLIVALDHTPLKRFLDQQDLQFYFMRLILDKQVGQTALLTIKRGQTILDIEVPLITHPMLRRDAPRTYFKKFGFTVAAFAYEDALTHKQYKIIKGGIVSFCKPDDSPGSDAELAEEDWILEINGKAAENYEAIVQELSKIEQDETLQELSLLIERNNETKLLRLKWYH